MPGLHYFFLQQIDMKLRKLNRITHRDMGYLFFAMSVIYGLSGISLNHIKDWNPNYIVSNEVVYSDLTEEIGLKNEDVFSFLESINEKENYKKHYYPNPNNIKIFLKGGSSITVNVTNGKGTTEYLKRRAVFYEANFLHYNPNKIWTWFSDAFSASLILFAITSFFMVKGKYGIKGRGGIYTLIGILIPLLFLLYFI
jgi:hypothetical protein